MYQVMHSDQEIDDLLNDCAEEEGEGTTRFKGMTYEQGIKAAIEWLIDPIFSHPLED